ncbi:MAG: proton-conducting transporter membrane subunit, partial [Myxococcota bacterium]
MRTATKINCAMIFLWSVLCASVMGLASVSIWGVQRWYLEGWVGSGFSFQPGFTFHAVSCLMWLMIGVLGVVIGQFSLRYLHGESQQGYFYRHLCGLVGSVSLFVLSDNLLLMFVFWCSTSFQLYRLLRMYADREEALIAARTKAIFDRINEAFWMVALLTVGVAFGTLDLPQLFRVIQQLPSASLGATLLPFAALLLVIVAMTMSAQLPFHAWLPDTMETPAPVSAIMHAGVVNAGGFLIIQLSPLIQKAWFANT